MEVDEVARFTITYAFHLRTIHRERVGKTCMTSVFLSLMPLYWPWVDWLGLQPKAAPLPWQEELEVQLCCHSVG